MTRPQLEHIVRAAAAYADVRDVIVIGSQSILGAYPDPPPELTRSMEADVFPKDVPERWELIDGSIGENSVFHETFGYYTHGVDETTATLPAGWRDRLVKVETAGTARAVGWCLEPNDLAVSKLLAGRGKDLAFVKAALRAGLVSPQVVRDRLSAVPGLSPELRRLSESRLDTWRRET